MLYKKNVKTNAMRKNNFFVFLNKFSFLQKSLYRLLLSYYYLDGPFCSSSIKDEMESSHHEKFSHLIQLKLNFNDIIFKFSMKIYLISIESVFRFYDLFKLAIESFFCPSILYDFCHIKRSSKLLAQCPCNMNALMNVHVSLFSAFKIIWTISHLHNYYCFDFSTATKIRFVSSCYRFLRYFSDVDNNLFLVQ